MHGAAAQRGRERYRRAKEAQEAKVRAAVELERARRVAAKEAEMKKRSIKNLLAMADRGAMGSLFQIWDRDGSGYIDRDEFDGQVVALGHEAGIEITSEMLDLAWADFDLDGSGSVTYEEWLRIMLRDVLAQGSGKIVDAFRAMDDDNSGAVNRNEFCDAIVAMGVDAPRILVEEVFDSMDVDGSGTLTFAELYKQIRPGSSVNLHANLKAGHVTFDTSRGFKNALRGSLVAQLTRHIQATPTPGADLRSQSAASPSIAGSVAAPISDQSTSLWVCQFLAKVGPKREASHRHTAVNDDHTSNAMAAQRGRPSTADAAKQHQRQGPPQRLLELLEEWEANALAERSSSRQQAAGGASSPSLLNRGVTPRSLRLGASKSSERPMLATLASASTLHAGPHRTDSTASLTHTGLSASLGDLRTGGSSSSLHRLAPFVVQDTLKTRSAQAMRIAALPPPRRDPHKVLNNVSMTKIQARIGPATCYIVPKVTDPDRSIDDDGTACWVCVHRSAGMRH